MNKEEIAGRVQNAGSLRRLAQSTREPTDEWRADWEEKMLLLDFIRHVGATGSKRLRLLANEVLKIRG